MKDDITQLLDEWNYQPGQINVRVIRGRDGGDKIQLRVDLGVLQMNVDGRPDGKRPGGHESLLAHCQAKLSRLQKAAGTEEVDFALSVEDCAKLHQEAVQYHHRYICHFQLGDHERVVRDAAHNLALCDFVERHAPGAEFAVWVAMLRPQSLVMHTRGRAELALRTASLDEAIARIQFGLDQLRRCYPEDSSGIARPPGGEVSFLEGWLEQLEASRPLTERQRLEQALRTAVQKEDYERAAKVRDALRKLSPPEAPGRVRPGRTTTG